jgi:hypothetical protein
MRQKVKKIKNKLKPNDSKRSNNSIPMSVRSSKSQLNGFMNSGMQASGFDRQEQKNQRCMSGFLKTHNNEISYNSVQPRVQVRSSSVNHVRNQFHSVQEALHEDSDVEELIARIEMLTKENKGLKDANR